MKYGVPALRPILEAVAASFLAAILAYAAYADPTRAWLYGADRGESDGSGTILRIDPSTQSFQQIGETGFENVFDLAFLPDGRLYGISVEDSFFFSDTALVRIHPKTASAEVVIEDLGVDAVNALVANGDGGLFAASAEGDFLEIDLEREEAHEIGLYGEDLVSSGDLTLTRKGTLFGTAIDEEEDVEKLVIVDPGTGTATEVGDLLGYQDVWGLSAGPNDELFAIATTELTGPSLLLRIDKSTGEASELGHLNAPEKLSGLAANIRRPPVRGEFVVTGPENPECALTQEVWTFCQHESGFHTPSGGIGDADEVLAWDMNLWIGKDTNADDGRPVRPLASGRVVPYAGEFGPHENSSGAVLIEHSRTGRSCDHRPADCWWSGYLHMERIQVEDGDEVDRSTTLGEIGDTFRFEIPDHLHLVVYEGENASGRLQSVDVVFTPEPSATLLQLAALGSTVGLASVARFRRDGACA